MGGRERDYVSVCACVELASLKNLTINPYHLFFFRLFSPSQHAFDYIARYNKTKYVPSRLKLPLAPQLQKTLSVFSPFQKIVHCDCCSFKRTLLNTCRNDHSNDTFDQRVYKKNNKKNKGQKLDRIQAILSQIKNIPR